MFTKIPVVQCCEAERQVFEVSAVSDGAGQYRADEKREEERV